MIFVSLVLVIVAAVALVLGVFQDGLVLVYVSIGTCVTAMAVLGAAVLLRRREEATGGAVGYAEVVRHPARPDDDRADQPDDGADHREPVAHARPVARTSAHGSVAHIARSEADLAAVRGLGPAKRGALLDRFGSVDAIADASVEELTATPGIGVGLARAIRDQLG